MKHSCAIFLCIVLSATVLAQTNACDTLPAFVSHFDEVYAWGIINTDNTAGEAITVSWACFFPEVGEMILMVDARVDGESAMRILELGDTTVSFTYTDVAVMSLFDVPYRSYTALTFGFMDIDTAKRPWEALREAIAALEYELNWQITIREIIHTNSDSK